MNPRHPPPKGRWNATLAGPACSIAALVIFAVGGVAGVLTIPLPHWTAWLWLAGGVPAALGALPSVASGLALAWRGQPLAGMAFIAAGLLAPWWWWQGVMTALSQP